MSSWVLRYSIGENRSKRSVVMRKIYSALCGSGTSPTDRPTDQIDISTFPQTQRKSEKEREEDKKAPPPPRYTLEYPAWNTNRASFFFVTPLITESKLDFVMLLEENETPHTQLAMFCWCCCWLASDCCCFLLLLNAHFGLVGSSLDKPWCAHIHNTHTHTHTTMRSDYY